MAEQKNTEGPNPRERFHDRVISLLLAAIWIVAALVVHQSDTEIPASMKELVKIIDSRVRDQLGLRKPDA